MADSRRFGIAWIRCKNKKQIIEQRSLNNTTGRTMFEAKIIHNILG